MAKKRTSRILKRTLIVGGHPCTEFEMVCVSSPKEIGRVEEFFREVNREARLDDGTFHRLFVATSEAINNAILHGNKSDPSKTACVTCSLNADSVVVKVKDEGPGFNPDNVPNPLDEENLLKESGRGLFLIRSMMDRVAIHPSPTGTTVEMMINLKRLR